MFNYRWTLSDNYPAEGVEKHNTTVMTTFSCGGGSSMGYKLAGYDVVCANDIDPKMKKVYEANHHPKQYILGPIKDLLSRDDLPQVDVLDGSPPCSTFSTAGSREKAWGKEKMFREGQAKQVLDDLFFDFIALAEKIQPKIVIAENVSGMLKGNAKGYVKLIVSEFERIGYKVQVFLLNAATMGVPQKRQRVFFICHKTNKTIKLDFNQKPIKLKDIFIGDGTLLKGREKLLWDNRRPTDNDLGKINLRLNGKETSFTTKLLHKDQTPKTLIASDNNIHYDIPRKISNKEAAYIGSFPEDYEYLDIQPKYLIGMSVPPVMMAQIAYQVYKQLIEV